MSTRDNVLAAFAGKTGSTLSGAAIARRLGITRASVWKAVVGLKADGFPIESRSRYGYEIDPAFDLSLFQFSRRPPAGVHVHYRTLVSSTQRMAKQAAPLGAPPGSLWLAERQTGGKGRLDRAWDSAAGGLWFSLLLRPRLPAAKVPPLTLVIAMRLRDTIEQLTGLRARLKWPNDVVIERAGRWLKLAGILTDMAGDLDRTHWVVAGVGVNVNNDLPPSLTEKATSLRTLTGKVWPRAKLLSRFLKEISADLKRFERHGFTPFRTKYWKDYSRPGGEVALQTAQGVCRGRAIGVDPSGSIILKSRRETQHFSEGEIVS